MIMEVERLNIGQIRIKMKIQIYLLNRMFNHNQNLIINYQEIFRLRNRKL